MCESLSRSLFDSLLSSDILSARARELRCGSGEDDDDEVLSWRSLKGQLSSDDQRNIHFDIRPG
jgi:hypothetical protein